VVPVEFGKVCQTKVFTLSVFQIFLEIKKGTTGRSKIWGVGVLGFGFSLFTVFYYSPIQGRFFSVVSALF
jgi:hypothetical protein